jgi:hypothetical protein
MGESYLKIEHQSYALVQKFPGFEVRYYPSAIVARLNMKVKTFREISTPGFRTLAAYIMGNNHRGQKMNMTAPVYIDMTTGGSSISFVMPSGYVVDDLPAPSDPDIRIEPAASVYLAVLAFGGCAGYKMIREQSEKLRKLLKENHIRHQGNFRFMVYNTPYKFWERRNEVAAQIIWE